MQRKGEDYNFIRPFMALAIEKLDLAIICRDSLVTSGSATISLSLFAWSPNSRKISFPCCTFAAGRLSLHTATILDTIVMICVKFSLSDGDGVGLLTPESTLWIAYTMDSVWASRYGWKKQNVGLTQIRW